MTGTMKTMRMTKTTLTVAAMAVLAFSCGRGADEPHSCSGAPRPTSKLLLHPETGVAGQYVVVFFDSVKDIPGTSSALASKYSGTILFVYEAAIRGFALKLDDSKAWPLSQEPSVCWVEQDQLAHGN
jgi:hypothetical protein